MSSANVGNVTLQNKIIPAANPTNSLHPVTSSHRCIARRFMHRSHEWHRRQRNESGKPIH